ncbi:MAG: septum formation initiator family protein [Gemmatimonadetes bacterium]|nr:septum formation initiator family protein [Gemmatimonadota bacterium]
MFTAGDARALGREEEALQAELKSLQRQVDSLRSFHDSLETSPAVQERVAREEWGVIRPGEMSIRLERGDSGPLTPEYHTKRPAAQWGGASLCRGVAGAGLEPSTPAL